MSHNRGNVDFYIYLELFTCIPRTTKSTTVGAAVDFGLCVVLLGDTSLMELPLEALRIFKAGGISSVSRDFSLQILYNRIHMAESGTIRHSLY